MTREPSDQATRERSRVALVTSDMFPDLWDDDHVLRDVLRARGVLVDAVCWDDPATAWADYDLAVLRSTWDYPARRDSFVDWARRVPRLGVPADLVDWNTDKRYLRDLAAAGVAVTPTEFIEPGASWTPPDAGEWVVKPTISVGSQYTGRYALPAQGDLASAHVARLHAAGRVAMVQPYLAAVDTAGETAVMFLPDATGELTFSHAIRKAAILTGPADGGPGLNATDDIEARTPSAAELSTAYAALAAVPGGTKRLLYARVDLIPGPDGAPMLVELELTEPSLYFRHAAGAAERLADAILSRL